MQTAARPRQIALNTQARIGLAFALLALVVFGIVGYASLRKATSQVSADMGEALVQIADRMAMSLDTGMAERYREIQNFASLELPVDRELAQWRSIVDRLQRSFSHYAWVALVAADGTVRAATGGVLEGANVAKRDWFQRGRSGTFVGDVHPAILLAKALPPRADGEPLRLVDLAAPVVEGGEVKAVLGAHLDWTWALERRRTVLETVDPARGIDVMVLDARGTPLLKAARGPEAMPLAGIERLLAQRHAMEPWSDGGRYLTVAVRSAGYQDYPGLGWIIVARQPADIALAAAAQVRGQMALFGLLGAALFGVLGWWLAGRLTAPLRALAARALAVAPAEAGAGLKPQDEVSELSRALGDLVTRLGERERELTTLARGLELRVAERTAALEQANADLKSFSHSVSHDLKGPLGSVGAGLRLVLTQAADRLDEPNRRMLTLLAGECDRLRQLVDELMALALVEQQTLRHETLSMDALVGRVVDDIRTQVAAGATPGAAATEVQIDALPEARGDPVLLRQVWHNLLSNAFKFSARAAAPQVRVRAEPGESEVVYVIEDNGAGFDAAHAERLFGLFQRLHKASDFPGTGIGLSIVKRIVQRHGGRVWAHATPGEGARFYVALPRSAFDEPAGVSPPLA